MDYSFVFFVRPFLINDFSLTGANTEQVTIKRKLAAYCHRDND